MIRKVFWVVAALMASGASHGQFRPSTPPSIGQAPAYLQYMSPRCASLHDSIRTSAARGLTYQTQAAARREYDQQCREDEREAMQQVSRNQQDQRTQLVAERQSQAKANERSQAQQQLCGESKRILKLKKARTDLTDGEKADLQRFEDNYVARCT